MVNCPFSIPVYASVMFGLPANIAIGHHWGQVMSSEWDLPESRHKQARPRPVASEGEFARHPTQNNRSREPRDAPGGGPIDPLALFRFVFRNIVKIGIIALVLTAIGIMSIRFMPFPYRATATVLVDPRDQQVTLQEDVLRSIGSDAAVLESMVQIMKSDGFLLTVMNQLGMMGGTESKLSQQEQLKKLAQFKRDLAVERKGATYLVEISYKADTAQEAARIANSVADGFANTQNGYLRQANEDAARALSERLVELRRKLNTSEKAVADFAAENGILYVDSGNTLEMRQLTELSAQMALAKNATEAARARYQSQIDGGTGGAMLNDPRNGEPEQLAYLRQQRAQLMQTLEQQSLTYGARHPRIAQTRQLIAGIERQIREERQSLTQQLKGDLDVAWSQQKKLEADIARLSSGVVLTDAAEVRLEALRREAAADRDIYEKFLSRNKATDELAAMKSDNVRVVSPAVPPLRSSRPSLMLLAPVFGFLSTVAAIVAVAAVGRPNADPSGSKSRRSLDEPAWQTDERSVDADAAPSSPEVRPGKAPGRRASRRDNSSLLMLGKYPDKADGFTAAPAAEARAASPDTSLLMMAKTMRGNRLGAS